MAIVTLANNLTFECKAQQSILDAAKANGLSLEHSCRTGSCGVCKALVLDGVTHAVKTEESLTQSDQASGFVLTCCRTAHTDVALDIEDLGELGKIETKTLPCRIDSLALLNHDVIEVILRTPPASHLVYVPGQHIDVIGKNGARRSYSVANAPRADGKLKLQIRKVMSGEMSRYWFEEAKCNDLLRLEGPLGTFCLRPTQAPQLVLLATGTGIAPFKAMLEQLALNPEEIGYSRIHLYWGGRQQSDLYWQPDFPELPLTFTSVLSRVTVPNAVKGYVQGAVLADNLDLEGSVVYACGSESMIASARAKLIDAGLSPKSFRSDAFVSSS